MKNVYIILTVAIVGLFALTGCTQSAQNQSSEQPSTQSSEQSQTSEQSSNQSQISEQSSTQSSELSQTSEQSSSKPTSSAEPSTPKEKITLDGVKDIIAKADKPENIFDKIYQTYQYDEDLSNEMHEYFRYWLNEDHTEAINVIRYDNDLPCSVFYETYDSQGQTTDSEVLYKYEEKITLAAVKDIISKSNPDSPWDVIWEIQARYKYDDDLGSGMYILRYWLNEKHKEAIVLYYGDFSGGKVFYEVYDSEENMIKSETLYEYSATKTSSADE